MQHMSTSTSCLPRCSTPVTGIAETLTYDSPEGAAKDTIDSSHFSNGRQLNSELPKVESTKVLRRNEIGKKWNVTSKVHTSMRLSVDGLTGLKSLGQHYRASQVAVIELLLYRELKRLKLLRDTHANPARITQAQLRAPLVRTLNRLPDGNERQA